MKSNNWKYLYRIRKLEIKSWLKYLMIEGKHVVDYVLGELTTGTDITIDNTVEKTFYKFDIKGNSTQETTTGKNKLKLPDLAQTTLNGLTFSIKDDVVTIDGSATSLIPICETTLFNIPVGTNAFEIIPISGTWTSGTLGLRGYTSTSSQKWYTQVAYNYNPKKVSKEYTEDELSVTARISFYSTATGVFSNFKFKIMIIEGSTYDSTFEEYTGGIASPNPSYSQEIYSAGDIQNLFNPNASDIETGKYLKTDSTTANSSVSNVSGYIAINPNVELNLNVTGDGNQRNVLFYDSNKTYLGADLIQTYYTNRTFISPQNAYYLRFTYYKNATTIELKPSVGTISEKIENSDGTQSQTYTIPVQQPMRSIGTVRDEFIKVNGVWYERHNIKSIIFNGSEGWSSTGTQYTGLYSAYVILSDMKRQNVFSGDLLSNHFIEKGFDVQEEGMTKSSQPLEFDFLILRISTDKASTAQELKTWLASNNTEVLYLLATPTDLPCTSEQIAILENLPKSYNEQTNIYSLDVTPAYLEVQAYVKKEEVIEND